MRYVNIEIGDKEYKLKYSFNAIADIEDRAGIGIGTLMSEERMGFNTIRILLWGGLRHQDKGLTMERAGNLIELFMGDDMDRLQELVEDYILPAFEKAGFVKNQQAEA